MIDLGELIVDLSILGVYPPHGGGGSGTVTSITGGTGIAVSPSPITTTGSVSLAPIATNRLLANPTVGTAAPVATTVTALFDAVFGATQGDILYRNGTNWTTLAPSTAGYVLQTGGPAANVSWVPAGGYTPFAYANTYWVSQTNGNDANAGTSIETPLATVQQAITLAGTAVARIYVVDANQTNNETIVTLGTGQTLFIEATGTSFQGSITQTAGDAVYLSAFYADAFVTNSTGTTYLEGGQFVLTSTASSVVYANVAQFQGFHTGGTAVFVNCNNLNAINIAAGCNVTANAPISAGITNAGTLNIFTNSNPASALVANTGTITGVMGDVTFGPLGIADSAGTTAAYSLTTAAPTAANQVLVSSGAGPGATTSWAAQGGYTPFAYANSLWVSMANGNDLNTGTSIETPLLTLQQALTLAGSTPTNIYIVDNGTNTETVSSISGTACNVNIIATGVIFNGAYLFQNAGDTYTIQCFSINNLTDNSSAANNSIIASDNVSGINDNSAGMNISAKAQISSYAYAGTGAPGLVSLSGNLLTNITFAPVDSVTVSISSVYLAFFTATVGSTPGSTYYVNAVFCNTFSQTGADNFFCQVAEGSPTISGGTFYGTFGGNVYANVVGGLGVGYQNIINYLLTSVAPTAAGQVLISTGASAPYGTVWGSSSGYIPFAYVNSYWVSQANGNDSNAGTSIETPLATFGQAITLAGSTNSIIYGVDPTFSNAENLTITGTVTIVAPGTEFNGIITNNSYLNIQAIYINTLIAASLTIANVTTEIANLELNGGSNSSINCPNTSTITSNNAGGNYYINANQIGVITTGTLDTCYILCSAVTSISNAGNLYITAANGLVTSNTGYIEGTIGNVTFGPLGIAGTSDSTPEYTLTASPPTAANQVLVSSGAGPGATTSWAAQGGFTPFAYTQALWVSQANGNDSNAGTSIDTPLLTIQNAINLAGTTPTMIYVVDYNFNNNETLATLGTGQTLYINAPGTLFNGSLTVTAGDTSFIINCNGLTTVVNNGNGTGSFQYITGGFGIWTSFTDNGSCLINSTGYVSNYTNTVGGSTVITCDGIALTGNIGGSLVIRSTQSISGGTLSGNVYFNAGVGIGGCTFTDASNPTLLAPTISSITCTSLGDPSLITMIASTITGCAFTGNFTANTFCNISSSNTNDGTCVINGILGNTNLSGFNGNSAIGGSLGFGDGSALNYTQTNAAPTAANQVLLSSGAGPGATTSWGAAGGYTPLAYAQTFWVSQATGNDANAGTSIETPFRTVQNAITTAATTPTMIYVVDGVNNSETIATLGTGQLLYIQAPGVVFAGASFTVNASDTLVFNGYQIGTFNFSGANLYANASVIGAYTQAGGNAYVNALTISTADCSAVAQLYLSTLNAVGITLAGTSLLFLQTNYNAVITNDGTCYVNGVLGSTTQGLFGSNWIGGTLSIGTAITTGNFYTLPDTDGTNGQTLVTNGTGTVTWASGSGYTPFAYTQAFWVASNGSDSNAGTSIETPFLTIQHAITTAGTTATVIYVPERWSNSEALTTSGAGQFISIQAPGSNLNSLTVASGDEVLLNALYLGAFAGTGDSNLTLDAIGAYTITGTAGSSHTLTAQQINTSATLSISGGSAGFIYMNVGNTASASVSASGIRTNVYYNVDESGLLTNNGAYVYCDCASGPLVVANSGVVTLGSKLNGAISSITSGFVSGIGNGSNLNLVSYSAIQDFQGGYVTCVNNATIDFTNLGTGGTVNIAVPQPTGTGFYQIVNIYINYGGTNFAGGDRDVILTDGLSTYVTISSAVLLTLPGNAAWGSASLPYPATLALNTPTGVGGSIFFTYSGGTTDYTSGTVSMTVVYAKISM